MTKTRRLTPAEDPTTLAIDAPAPRRRTAKADATPKTPRRRTAKADATAPAAKPAKPAKAARTKTTTAKSVQPKSALVEPATKPARARTRKVAAALPAQVVTLPIPIRDQPIGQAAQEIARIRAEMQHIRHMIDGQPVIHNDARMMLQRLCQNPTPRGMLAGSTASVIQLAPHLHRQVPDMTGDGVPSIRPRRTGGKTRGRAVTALAVPLAIEESPVADALLQQTPAPVVVVPAVQAPVAPRSRIARLFSAWGDWLLWRLLPPTMPVQASGQAPVTVHTPVRGPVTDSMVALPQGHGIGCDGPDRPRSDDPAPTPQLPVAQIVAQTVAEMMDDKAMRAHLQEMIREELEGEMGARFSGNLRAVVRREIASALDERLTHL